MQFYNQLLLQAKALPAVPVAGRIAKNSTCH
jgi:hypothetical protein